MHYICMNSAWLGGLQETRRSEYAAAIPWANLCKAARRRLPDHISPSFPQSLPQRTPRRHPRRSPTSLSCSCKETHFKVRTTQRSHDMSISNAVGFQLIHCQITRRLVQQCSPWSGKNNFGRSLQWQSKQSHVSALRQTQPYRSVTERGSKSLDKHSDENSHSSLCNHLVIASVRQLGSNFAKRSAHECASGSIVTRVAHAGLTPGTDSRTPMLWLTLGVAVSQVVQAVVISLAGHPKVSNVSCGQPASCAEHTDQVLQNPTRNKNATSTRHTKALLPSPGTIPCCRDQSSLGAHFMSYLSELLRMW